MQKILVGAQGLAHSHNREQEVDFEKFAREFFRWYHERQFPEGHVLDFEEDSVEDFHARLLGLPTGPDDSYSVIPPLALRAEKHWAMLVVWIPQPKEIGGHRPLIAFGFRTGQDNSSGEFKYKPLPEGNRLEVEWNSTRRQIAGPIMLVGDAVKYTEGDGIWPFPVLDPEVCRPVGMLNLLMTASDRFALHSLCHSPQPTRGHGARLRDELESVRQACVAATLKAFGL